jgi:hypothetical protein
MKRGKTNKNVRMDVRASRIATVARKRHAEYQVVCFSRASDLQKTVTRFEEWRRYSEFYDLDQALREEFGYHMEAVKFPPKRTFGNLDPAFVAQRQQMLSEYLQLVLKLANVADFEKHHCSKQLRAFVGYDLHLNPPTTTAAGAAKAASSKRASSRQQGGGRYQRISRRAAGPSAAPVRARTGGPITAVAGTKPTYTTAAPAQGPSSAASVRTPAAATAAAPAAAVPSMPSMPAMPAMPSMPSMPSMPAMPALAPAEAGGRNNLMAAIRSAGGRDGAGLKKPKKKKKGRR